MAEDGQRAGRREALVRLLQLGGLSAGVTGGALWLARRDQPPAEPKPIEVRHDFRVPANPARPAIAVARGGDPGWALRQVIADLGGAGRFISHGDRVALKPNMAWDRAPEQAANTNPQVVAEMVRLCLAAGAKSVLVGDVSIHDSESVFERSGIAGAARTAGATVLLPEPRHFRDVDLGGDALGVWPVFTPLLEVDKIINLPIAKQHSLTGVSLGLKNWFGILGGRRQKLHQRVHECIADLAAFVRPTLTILDAWRVLLREGPTGGNLEDVAPGNAIIAGTDPVAIDAWAARTWWSLDESSLPYLKLAAERGLGTTQFEKLDISYSQCCPPPSS